MNASFDLSGDESTGFHPAPKSYQSIKVQYLVGEGDIEDLPQQWMASEPSSGKNKYLVAVITGLAFCAIALSSQILFDRRETRAESDKGMEIKYEDLIGEKEEYFPSMGDPDSSDCVNVPNWRDSLDSGCDWYEEVERRCRSHGNYFDEGLGTATEGCCACGGGLATAPTHPDPAPPVSSTPSPTPQTTVVSSTNESTIPDASPRCPNEKSFIITLINAGTNTEHDHAFLSAKERWESIIKCDLADMNLSDLSVAATQNDWFGGELAKSYRGSVDDVVIGYEFKYIDGAFDNSNKSGAKLGSAKRLEYRRDTGSTISAVMIFDEDDFNRTRLSKEDEEVIILHEMGHALGLVNDVGTKCFSPCEGRGGTKFGWAGPEGSCFKTQDEYAKLNLGLGPLRVDSGQCAHWDERSFPAVRTGSSELMTPDFRADYPQPLSRVTIAALDEAASDYVVDYSAADPYPFPRDTRTDVRPTSSFSLDTDSDGTRRLVMA